MSINFTGVDLVIAEFDSRARKIEGVTNHMLNAGAKIMKEEMKASMQSFGLSRTGDMIKSIKSFGIQKGKAGSKYVSIAPAGRDRFGIPNKLKANVAEHGKKGQSARPWLSRAEASGAPKALDRMQEIYDEKMRD
jgi:hypothetical protein